MLALYSFDSSQRTILCVVVFLRGFVVLKDYRCSEEIYLALLLSYLIPILKTSASNHFTINI